jgi:hypothetical protein
MEDILVGPITTVKESMNSTTISPAKKKIPPPYIYPNTP